MKKIMFLCALFCASLTMFAETVTVSLANGSHDGSKITWKEVSDNITITQNKGTSSSTVNANYVAAPRMYKGHYLAFECAENYTINGIELSYTGSYTGNSITAGTAIDGNTVTDSQTAITRVIDTENGGTHKFTVVDAAGVSTVYIQNTAAAKNTQLRLTAIKINYTKAATTEPSINAPAVDFGKVFKSEETTLTVTGENLSDAITYSLGGGQGFSVTGTLTATGGDLTVAFDATVAGSYSDVLTLTSGSATKIINLTAEYLDLTGNGTKESPFTVADVKAMNNEIMGSYWVSGYILGSAANNGEIAATVGNNSLLLGETASDETGITVQLVIGGAAQTALNVQDNEDNVGKEVKVYGSLEAYYSVPGVKGVETEEHYEWITSATGLEKVELTNRIFAIDGKINAPAEARIFNLIGMDVTHMNGQLENGIFLVKVGKNVTKVLVKK